jgi:hypothetical protein
MVEQPHVDQREGLPQPPGDPFIRLARLDNPGRVIVGDNQDRLNQGCSAVLTVWATEHNSCVHSYLRMLKNDL